MKRTLSILLSAILLCASLLAGAQTAPKIGGYAITTFKASDVEGANGGEAFSVRLVRFYVTGKITPDFDYKFQAQLNGTPHMRDYYLEWVKYPQFRVKVGQFKRPFTYENPFNPWDLGNGDYSLGVRSLAATAVDRCGAPTAGGRDQGVQIQGDLLPLGSDGHRLLHYQIGVFNGNGINVKNDNLSFAYVGQLEIKPIKDLKFHASAYLGEYKLNDSVEKALRNRYAVGAEYSSKTWMLRSEYVWGVTELNNDPLAPASTMNQKSDGFYAQAAYNFYLKCKNGKTQTLYPVVRYDYYAKNSEVNAGKSTYWLAGIGWWPEKHLRFQLNYTLRHEIGKENLGHYVAAQATVKF